MSMLVCVHACSSGRLVPPPLYVNTVYKSYLQLNAVPHSYLHCACVWECTSTQCLICMSNYAQESPTV